MNNKNKIIILITAALLLTPVQALGQTPAKLSGAKLQACQSREQAIKKRSKKLIVIASNAMSIFDRVANRTGNIYASRVVPQRKTVPNYKALLTELNTKKVATVSSLNQAKTTAAKFNCTADDPQILITQFYGEMEAVKRELKNYRATIHNLIAAVAKASGENIK